MQTTLCSDPTKRLGNRFIPLLLAIFLMPSLCHAQQQQNSLSDSAADDGSAVRTDSNAAVLQELETMRRRIEQLEAQLKAQSTAKSETTSVDSVERLETARQNLVATDTEPVSPPAEPPIATASLSTQKSVAPTGGTSEKSEPFAFADFTWLNGNPRTETPAFDSKFFTAEIRADVNYTYDFRHPKDDTIGGSSEIFRANEVQITQMGVGGDFHYDQVRARFMTQFGMYSTTTPRNDSSYSRGQWQLDNAYRYFSEAYGGYHWNKMHGINLDAGIFVSYVGLFSYYNFDNWAYQPSYVSSNTPWFFTGVRAQFFVSDKVKIEPWFVNGWQSYGRFNNRPGIGGQILWRPNGKLSILGNQYALGEDALNTPGRVRYHTDDSIQYKYLDRPEEKYVSKAAFSLTGDAGCEHGGGVSCAGDSAKGPKQSFLGFMVYNRLWFDRNLFGFTVGGGRINNPGRYLVLLPPINGANATSGTPYFTENPGDPYKAWDVSTTFDYMPSQYITWRLEYNHRAANVPYFSGPGGITPSGGNQGAPGSMVPGFTPDLRNSENRMTGAVLVKF
jgi:hypothetical protein